MKTLSVLIVTWNNEDTISRCVAAAKAACTGLEHEILVWDNASSDATRTRLGELLPPEHVVAWPENVGFAAGNNALARRAAGENLLLLNPDAYVDEDSMRALLAALASAGDDAIVGGKLESSDGSPQLASARPFPTSGRTALWLVAQTSPYWWRLPEVTCDIDAVSGAFFLIPARLWRALGGFDEEYPHSCEDLDLCWRAREGGARVLYEPRARAVHEVGVSVHQATPEIEVLRWMGLARFVRLREGRRGAAVLRTALAVQTTARLALTRFGLLRATSWSTERARLLRQWSFYGDLPDLPGSAFRHGRPQRAA